MTISLIEEVALLFPLTPRGFRLPSILTIILHYSISPPDLGAGVFLSVPLLNLHRRGEMFFFDQISREILYPVPGWVSILTR